MVFGLNANAMGKNSWEQRTTFLINEKGVITYIIENVDTENHASQIISH